MFPGARFHGHVQDRRGQHADHRYRDHGDVDVRRDQESRGREREHGDYARADVLDRERQRAGLRERCRVSAEAPIIRDNNIVVWRFHDNLHARQPDMTSVGLAQAIGWKKYASKTESRVYDLPRVTLRDVARDIEKRLKLPVICVIGDPQATVTRGALMQGTRRSTPPPCFRTWTSSSRESSASGKASSMRSMPIRRASGRASS